MSLCHFCLLDHREYGFSPGDPCFRVKAASDATNMVATNVAATNVVATNARTANRRDRGAFNAYQREYMREYRKRKRGG